jgi:hypothetical protein
MVHKHCLGGSRRGRAWGWLVLVVVLLTGCHKPTHGTEPGDVAADQVTAPPARSAKEPKGPRTPAPVQPSTPSKRETAPPDQTATDSTTVPATEVKPKPPNQGEPLLAWSTTKVPKDEGLATYQEVWSTSIADSAVIRKIYIAADGSAVGYWADQLVTVFQPNGTERSLKIPQGHITAPLPNLQTWLTKQPHQEGALRAWNLDGKVLWESPAPPGAIQVGPEGRVIVISGGEKEKRNTVVYLVDGTVHWKTNQIGGAVSFADSSDFLIWDQEMKRWEIISPLGSLRHGATTLDERRSPFLVSLDGSMLIDPENGVLEVLQVPEAKDATQAAGASGSSSGEQQPPALVQGPGPLFASNRLDLFIFLKFMGEHSKLQALRRDGTPLWAIPAGPVKGVVAPDGRLVFLLDGVGLRAVSGATGSHFWLLPGARDLVITPDGRYLLVLFSDKLSLYQASEQKTGVG